MATHELKCWPNAFEAIRDGRKRFEWRKDDRGFEVGDELVLRKWDPAGGYGGRHGEYVMTEGKPIRFGASGVHATYEYTELRVRVTYILRGMFGVPDGYCVMSIEPIVGEE